LENTLKKNFKKNKKKVDNELNAFYILQNVKYILIDVNFFYIFFKKFNRFTFTLNFPITNPFVKVDENTLYDKQGV
jgi:hypothetical protein